MKTMNTKKRDLFFLLIFTYAIIPVVIFGQSITPPQCYSGKRLLKEFIKEEMVYPEKALQDKTEGTVEISFMVNKDGSTSNYRIVKSVSNDLDNEAIRICRKILWYPAVDLGRPVDYENKFEIKFDIKKYEKICRSRGYEKTEYPFLPIDTGNIVFQLVDIDIAPKPEYSSKDANFNSFIATNLEYPEAAFKQNVSGRVKLTFVVEPSSRISNIVVDKSLGGGCTEEAIRVIKLLRWNPGIIENTAVRTWMCIEITFDIAKQSVAGSIPTPGQVH